MPSTKSDAYHNWEHNNQPIEEKCEYCKAWESETGYGKECKHDDPIEEKWKEGLLKLIICEGHFEGTNEYDTEKLESFIENLLEQEKKRMSDEIEKMKKTRFIGDTKSPTEDTEWISRNQALDEVLSIINK